MLNVEEGGCLWNGKKRMERHDEGRVKLGFCTHWPTDINLMISSHSQILDTTAKYEQSRDPPEAMKHRFVDNKYSTRSGLPVKRGFDLISY